jgi:hypothetical protein
MGKKKGGEGREEGGKVDGSSAGWVWKLARVSAKRKPKEWLKKKKERDRDGS